MTVTPNNSDIKDFYDNTPYQTHNNCCNYSRKIYNDTALGVFIRDYDYKNIRSIIDVGCGSVGKNISFIYDCLPSAEGITLAATDISFKSLIKARENHKNVQFLQADTSSLPFDDNSFDFILCTGSVHHMENPEKAINELIRILDSKKYMYLTVYNRNNVYYYLYNYPGRLFRFMGRLGLTRFINYALILPYYFIYCLTEFVLLKNIRYIPYAEARSDFFDRFMVPIAHFYTYEDISNIIGLKGAIVEYRPHAAGIMLGFLAQKT